jgi:radical SAM superfamily enzyme YgiQ (UPF0313 family)
MAHTIDVASVEPFEICSIRPPTENFSLTFRLTRNCGWNQCLFCPVYKYGARFSRRPLEDVKRDVDRARVIDDLLSVRGVVPGDRTRQAYGEASTLVAEIRRARGAEGPDEEAQEGLDREAFEDERVAWFASWFKERPTLEDSIQNVLAWRLHGGETCFLGDANGLVVPPGFFLDIVSYIKAAFPTLRRFTVYGRTRSVARKKPEDLAAFAAAGLHRIHFGIESGSDAVLAFMRKGETAADHIEGCVRTRQAGLSPSVYVMPGLGGAKWSLEHAVETARVLTRARPDYVRLRSMEVFAGTGLAAAVEAGTFVEASEEQVVREIRTLVEQTETETVIVSDSASNLLDVNGRLPEDRDRMLDVIDDYLSLSSRAKLAYSLESRLQSFMGQYGGVTEDIMRVIRPCIAGDRLDISGVSDNQVVAAIRLIRGKLMP